MLRVRPGGWGKGPISELSEEKLVLGGRETTRRREGIRCWAQLVQSSLASARRGLLSGNSCYATTYRHPLLAFLTIKGVPEIVTTGSSEKRLPSLIIVTSPGVGDGAVLPIVACTVEP